MIRYLLLQAIKFFLSLFLLASIVFFLMRVLPGDPALRLAGINASPESVAQLQEKLGSDEPIMVQYVQWMTSLLRLDFGMSLIYSVPVAHLVADVFSYTLMLAMQAFLLSILIAIVLSLLALFSKTVHSLVLIIETMFMSMPLFWIATLLILLFAVYLGILPAYGNSYALPVLSLALANMPILVRSLRMSLQEEMRKPYILFARSCGFSHLYILLRVAAPNASTSFIHIAAVQLGYLLGGNIIVESIFSLPGLGNLLLQSIFNRDYPLVQAVVLIFASLFIACMYLADILVCIINPRIRARY